MNTLPPSSFTFAADASTLSTAMYGSQCGGTWAGAIDLVIPAWSFPSSMQSVYGSPGPMGTSFVSQPTSCE
jgi:hypothetical protein